MLRRDAGPRIPDLQRHGRQRLAQAPRRHGDRAPSRGGVEGVAQEIDHYLLELRDIAHDRRQRLIQGGFNLHDLLGLGLPEQQCRPHHSVEVEQGLLTR